MNSERHTTISLLEDVGEIRKMLIKRGILHNNDNANTLAQPKKLLTDLILINNKNVLIFIEKKTALPISIKFGSYIIKTSINFMLKNQTIFEKTQKIFRENGSIVLNHIHKMSCSAILLSS